jgi:hypothetical protein
MLHAICRTVLFSFTVLLLGALVPARADLLADVRTELYAGRTETATAVAQRWLDAAPSDDQARFALGAAQFLRAVERLGQSLHRYGLQTEYSDQVGLLALPILRLPIPENPHPEPINYGAFRSALADFVADLKTADGTLAKVGDGDINLPLDIGLIRLDLRADGAASEDESLWALFARVSGYPRAGGPPGPLLTDFDAADVPWLRGYCNLLMAIAEFPLGYDFHDTFDWSFQSVFADGAFAAPELAARDREMREKSARLGEPPPYSDFKAYSAWEASPEGRRNEELRKYGWISRIADLVAALHETHWPVAEPERLASALDHLQTMIAQSRENWRRIQSDTNPGRRWIPNPQQTGVLPAMRVTPERIVGWMAFLDGFDAVLQGKSLIPHWRFDKGINLRRFFLEPRPFDLVMLVQGGAVLPYLEEGAVLGTSEAQQVLRAFEGDFFRYFLWFN